MKCFAQTFLNICAEFLKAVVCDALSDEFFVLCNRGPYWWRVLRKISGIIDQ